MLGKVCRPVKLRGGVTTRRVFTRNLEWSRLRMRYDAMPGHVAAGCPSLIGVQTLVSDDLEIIRRVLHGEIDRFADVLRS